MTYMLDTNMVIMAMRPNKWPDVAKKVIEHLRVDACISAVVYAELEYGLCKRDDKGKNRIAPNQTLQHVPIVPFDKAAAEEFGKIYADLDKKHSRIGDRDAPSGAAL